MTVEEKIIKMLVDRGFFPKWATEVVVAMKADEANKAMQGRWDDDVDGYPSVVISALWFSAEDHALAWIDSNKPDAWFRPVFAK